MSEGVVPHRPEWVGHPPAALTTLIGRDAESAEVGALLLRPAVRLVTLTGPGGVGKSRLGMRVAAEIESGVDTIAFVPLAPVRDPRLVAVTIAGALGITAPDAGRTRTRCGRTCDRGRCCCSWTTSSTCSMREHFSLIC